LWDSVHVTLLAPGVGGKTERKIEEKGRLRERRKQLLAILKEKRGYWKLKEEALDRTVWRTRFVRGYVLVVRQITEWKM
jgi:hypothetical protein